MSKELFFEMRAEDMATMYDASFTKSEAVKQGINLVNQILDFGLVDKLEFMTNIVRLKAVIDSAENEMRNHLPQERTKILGVEFTPVNGGNSINYVEDSVYCVLKKDVENRVELLKLAQKQEVFDLSGNIVPKVGTSPRKSSITIKF